MKEAADRLLATVDLINQVRSDVGRARLVLNMICI